MISDVVTSGASVTSVLPLLSDVSSPTALSSRPRSFAGSHTDMAQAVRNAVEMLAIDLPEAIQMATRNPAAFLGLDAQLGRIAAGYRANLVLADDSLRVLDTWIDGCSLSETSAAA